MGKVQQRPGEQKYKSAFLASGNKSKFITNLIPAGKQLDPAIIIFLRNEINYTSLW